MHCCTVFGNSCVARNTASLVISWLLEFHPQDSFFFFFRSDLDSIVLEFFHVLVQLQYARTILFLNLNYLFVCFWYAVYFFDIHIHLFINFREIVLYHICEYMDFLFSISSLHYLFFASFMGLYYDDLKSFIYVSDSIFSHVYSVHCCFCFRINFAMELF